MKQTKLIRMLAFILVIVMLLEVGPMQVFATENGNAEETVAIPLPEVSSPQYPAEVPELYIEGEVTELRSEYEKHYRLTDGSFMAVQYQVPVHYEDEGQWVDIDNTLEAVTMFSGDTVYQAVNGENVQAFASDLSDGTIMTMATDDHMISMSIWIYDSVEEAAIEDEYENSVAAEDDTEETEPVATQESVPEEPADSAEATEASDPDNELVGDDALADEEWSDMAEVSLDAAENVLEDTTIEDQQDDTIVAQILTEEGSENPVEDTEKTEPWELDDVMPDALSSSILYEDVFPGVDLRYDTFSYNVKESIILKQPMDLDEYAYSFLLTLDGLEPELQEDGSILLLDDDYEVQYTIPAPYMWDSEDVYSDAVFYELEETDEGWVLTVCADEDWLEEEERVYPVIIDPSVEIKNDKMLFTTAVETGTPTSTSGFGRPGYTTIGLHERYGQFEGYIKITELPYLPIGCFITEAKLSPGIFGNTKIAVDFRVDINKLTEEVSTAEWRGHVPWSDRPDKEPLPMDFTIVSYNAENYMSPGSWDITPAVKSWYNGSSPNYGLSLTSTLMANSDYSCVRLKAEHVNLVITYRNTVGTEDYYTYETQSAVRAGTGYVGDFDSSLTVIKNDLNFSSATTPFSVAHVFNSELRDGELDSFETDTIAPDYAKMLMGYGWQLSVLESVKRTKVGDTTYLVYRDGDGTQHYFKKNDDGVFEDEDGLGLKITQSSTSSDLGYTMKDKTENQKYFRNGYLKYIKDTDGNKICFLYDGATYSDDHATWHPDEDEVQLTSIVAARNGGTTQLICSFTYNERNQLTKITDYADRVTTFYYGNKNGEVTENGCYLVKIKHPDGTTAHYQYNDDSQLVRMFDAEAGYGIEYGYSENGVASIHEYTSDLINGTQTQGTHVERRKLSLQETEYRYDGNDREFNTDDDIVNCYSFDYAGRTINAVTLDTTKENILGVTAAAYTATSSTNPAANNRISKTGQSGQNGVNLLKNSGMEYANGNSDNPDWRAVASQTGKYVGEISNTTVRTGQKALKTTIEASAANNHTNGRVAGMYQLVDLKAYTTYTFSAYVNTNGISDFSTGGIYAAFLNSNNGILASGNKVSYKTVEDIDDGWQRVYCTFTPENNIDDCRVAVIQEDAYGSVYYDDLQLEVGEVPSTANLLQDATFDIQTSYWSGDEYSYLSNSDDPHHPNVLSINGEATEYVRVSQQVKIGQVCTDQTFLLSGWGKAASAAGCETQFAWSSWNDISKDHGRRYFGLIAQCHYTNGDDQYTYTDYHFMPFNDDYDDWQFASCVIVPDSYYQKVGMRLEYIDVYVVYDNNFNTMYVDNLSLRQEPCTTYSYNVAGNISAVNATGSANQAVRYVGETDDTPSSDPRPATVWKSESEVYYYQYKKNDAQKYLPEYISNALSMVYTYYDYDEFGNTTETEVGQFEVVDEKTRPSSYRKINSYARYSEDGSLLEWQKNGNGQETTYEYNKYRDVIQTTDAKGNKVVSLEYNMSDRAYMSYINGKVSVAYEYDRGLLTRIGRGGYIGNDPVKQIQYYNMSYDSFGNMEQVSVGTDADTARVLVNYSYGEYNNHLDSMTYGNGDRIEYLYDELDRVEYEIYKDSTGTVTKKYQYVYNAEGALAKKLDVTVEDAVDNGTADAVNYEYDSLGRTIHSNLVDANGIFMLTEHLYDRQNRIDEQTWQLRNTDGSYTTYMEEYQYRGSDGSIKKMVPAIGKSIVFTYDAIARLSNQSNDVYSRTYNYKNIDSKQTTTQIASIAYAADGTSFVPFTLTYSYDLVGNISAISCAQLPAQNTSYEYDEQGQMVIENINGNSYEYAYDTYGNLRAVYRVDGDVKTQLHSYEYGNSEWLDLLTEFDNQPIYYDEIGNPTSYYNGTRWDFEWANGRQLMAAESTNHDISFTYDMAGIRDSKSVGDITYEYMTLSGKVMRQTWEDEGEKYVINFAYDNAGHPYAFTYEGNTYYYVLNQQGDVIRIVNENGVTKAEYQYNAWGKILGTTGELAEVNPLRYRGYYYDTETGFYYLQSRYYDPTIGRFINADTFVSTGQEFLGYNMFAYCLNNPVNKCDQTGKSAIAIGLFIGVSALIGGIAGAYTAITTGGNVLESTLEGAVLGAVAATATIVMPLALPATASATATAGATFLAAGAAGAVVDTATQWISHKVSKEADKEFKLDGGRVLKTAALTGVAGVVPTYGKPGKSIVNALGSLAIGFDASFINASIEVILTNLLK